MVEKIRLESFSYYNQGINVLIIDLQLVYNDIREIKHLTFWTPTGSIFAA